MKYLLDVNALIAYGFVDHDFHVRVSTWANSLELDATEFATTPITELGFVRVLTQTPAYRTDIDKARHLLAQVKATSPVRFTFITDDHGILHLPTWVRTGKQTTDGHLAQLARSNGAILATLDKNIPGSFVIPA